MRWLRCEIRTATCDSFALKYYTYQMMWHIRCGGGGMCAPPTHDVCANDCSFFFDVFHVATSRSCLPPQRVMQIRHKVCV